MSLNAVIDLSHWNTVSDFAVVKAGGIVGVIHKATQGMRYIDPRFLERQQPILDAGLLRGAYHFGVAGSGVAQAQFFLDTTQPESTDLLALDWEHSVGDAGDMSLVEAETFCATILAEAGRWPVLYSGQAFLTEHLQGERGVRAGGAGGIPRSYAVTSLFHCPLWIARYSVTQKPVVPPPWSIYAPYGGGWTFWQYTDGAHGQQPRTVEGIGPCDRSFFNGTENELRALWTASTATT